jgi:hypothetical protein
MKKAFLIFLLFFNITAIIKSQVVVEGDITSDMTLTSSNTYLLKGFVRVKSGATLTIEPGTIIYGENVSQGALIVQPGGKINAVGTASNPIIFTSEFNKPGSSQTPTYGDWGGIILLGNAPINVPGGTAAIEGPGDTYGGSNADDNSGIMKYVRIEYPGIAFSPNNEINGLTFGGVGRGTTIDYIQVSYSGDDSYEWFGGTVNCKHLIAYRGWDDDFDTDFGYQGKLQFLLGVRDPEIADVSGSNGFESDNDGSGSTNEPRTSPTWWNVTLVGPLANSSTSINSNFKRGMHLRRSSQNKINNALIMGYPTGVLIDGSNTNADAQAGIMYLKNSIIAGCTKNLDTVKSNGTFDISTWFTNNSGRIYSTNDELILADVFNLNNPNPMPNAGSPVLTGGITPPSETDKFYDRTANYVGAFGFSDWTAGWSSFNLTVPEKPQDVLAGDITSDITLTADKDYTLKGFVRVKSGATLTIDPGVTVYGENSSIGSLIVQPGGRIKAEGTADNPIIFTSEFNKDGSTQTPTYGDWGGIILLGKAPINVPGGTASIEGPGDTYGGTDPNDNSGVMKYVRIEYPGVAFSPNNEINGLTFGGVGRGTEIDYVQVNYSGDDSYEWFGGTVNCKHLIAYRGWDDDFDTDFGYQGKLQFLLGVRDPEIADVSGSNGFESDNDGSGSTNEPRTSPTWWNVTLVGPKANTSSTINSNYKRGMHLRRSSQNKINNALIMGYPTGLLIDGSVTNADAQAGLMYVKNSIFAGCDKNLDTTKSNGFFDITNWLTAINTGRILSSTAEVELMDAFNLSAVNPFPASSSPVYTNAGTPPSDGFFDADANYVGAFGKINWTLNWTNNINIPSTVDVKESKDNLPSKFELSQNYPNPFNPSTTISFAIPKAGNVKLVVYNLLGQQAATLINGYKDAGYYKASFDGSNLSSGIYLYRLETESVTLSNKMTFLK